MEIADNKNVVFSMPMPITCNVETQGSFSGFLKSLSVYINKPHVVNRRLVGGKLIYYSNVRQDSEASQLTTEGIISRFSDGRETTPVKDIDLKLEEKGCFIVRDLIPRQIDRYPTLREFIEFDATKKKFTFSPLCRITCVKETGKKEIDTKIEDEMIYSFTFIDSTEEGHKVKLDIERKKDGDSHVTIAWLEQVLLVKLARWAEEENLRTGQTSLCLVQVDEYNKLYNHLKQKYGLKLVEVWPEKTDPQKFVYEDIAIATYLLLLWKEDREIKKLKEKQSFVDLGCGNGLLVYILSAEGHQGVGLDLRKRNIWDWFGPSVNLKEEAITPSGDTLFSEYDWLIGNHSDELTPWIPVMTARSSFSCCFFVLPCCHHDFDRKFNHREVGESQYRSYLNFVKEVGGVCGFNVEEDTLRIPSTKRVCFIGRSRSYSQTLETSIDEKRTLYIDTRCSKGVNSISPCVKGDNLNSCVQADNSDNSADCDSISNKKIKLDENSDKQLNQWSNNFIPRSNKEIPRNCQSVARDTKEKIVNSVFEKILAAEDGTKVTTNHSTVWNRGGTIALSSVAELFNGDVLQQLKSECGGLQTLLRNHNHIFQVTGGVVRLRDLSSDDPWGYKNKKSKKKAGRNNEEELLKTMLCWFHDHHPDGCPRLPENCRYAHGKTELRQKARK